MKEADILFTLLWCQRPLFGSLDGLRNDAAGVDICCLEQILSVTGSSDQLHLAC